MWSDPGLEPNGLAVGARLVVASGDPEEAVYGIAALPAGQWFGHLARATALDIEGGASSALGFSH